MLYKSYVLPSKFIFFFIRSYVVLSKFTKTSPYRKTMFIFVYFTFYFYFDLLILMMFNQKLESTDMHTTSATNYKADISLCRQRQRMALLVTNDPSAFQDCLYLFFLRGLALIMLCGALGRIAIGPRLPCPVYGQLLQKLSQNRRNTFCVVFN